MAHAVIAFITDAEGNFDYFRRCVELSQVVSFDGTGRLQFARAGVHDVFVFGGDAFDKGPGDIRIANALLQFKESHRERVFFLAGNRDLNKLRFAAEMAEDCIDVPHPVPVYPRAPAQVSYRAFLERVAAERRCSVDDVNTRPNRLRWILDHTMTARGCFEYRREELTLLAEEGADEITDDDVVRSFVDSVERDDGFVWRYLQESQLALVFGDTLFVHGGVFAEGALGWIPNPAMRYKSPAEGETCGGKCLAQGHSVQQWADAMNAFLRQGLQDFRSQMMWRGPDDRSRGGEALMAMTSTPACFKRSIVVECLLQAGSPEPMPQEAEAYLAAGGVRRVVCGHKPCGDSPFVVRRPALEAVHCDTTFSDQSAPDSRGHVVAAVEIQDPWHGRSQTQISGVLRDGRSYAFQLPTPGDGGGEEVGDAMVGRQIAGGKWVKALLGDGLYHTASSKPGDRHVSYETMSTQEVKEALVPFALAEVLGSPL